MVAVVYCSLTDRIIVRSDPALVRVLTDKLYEKRKATALELEK